MCPAGHWLVIAVFCEDSCFFVSSCMYVCMYVCTCVCVCVCVCVMYICMYMCVCVRDMS
jgi:hypothetical protein